MLFRKATELVIFLNNIPHTVNTPPPAPPPLTPQWPLTPLSPPSRTHKDSIAKATRTDTGITNPAPKLTCYSACFSSDAEGCLLPSAPASVPAPQRPSLTHTHTLARPHLTILVEVRMHDYTRTPSAHTHRPHLPPPLPGRKNTQTHLILGLLQFICRVLPAAIRPSQCASTPPPTHTHTPTHPHN